jgi:hypothetical protein
MSGFFKEFRKSLKPGASLRHVRANVLTVRNYHGLKQAMGWTRDPILEEDWLFRFENLTDINDRRIRDAEVLGAPAPMEIRKSCSKSEPLAAKAPP